MNFELRPNLNTVQLSKNRSPFESLRANGESKGSARTTYVNSIGLNLKDVWILTDILLKGQ